MLQFRSRIRCCVLHSFTLSQSIAMHKMGFHVKCALYPNACYIGVRYNRAQLYKLDDLQWQTVDQYGQMHLALL